MAIKSVSPYLMFQGNASEALKHYEKTLGAKVEHLMRFDDPSAKRTTPCPPDEANRVMHAFVRIGEASFMVSDEMPGPPHTPDSNVQIAVEVDDVDEMLKRFDALAAGGKVRLAPQDMFWGAKFGMLTDKFGIEWMLSCTPKKA